MTPQHDPLQRILAPQPPPFALLHRPQATGAHHMDVLLGTVSTPDTLTDIPTPQGAGDDGVAGHEVLVIVPYRQITERGFACVDDHCPLIAMQITDQTVMPVSEVLSRLPDTPIQLTGERFEPDDDTYADTVHTVLTKEIGTGEGANFVIKRSFLAEITDYTPTHALTFFRRLCQQETGAHWTFIAHTGTRTLVGATPERHITLHNHTAVMNPISGTYRYPPTGPTLPGLLDFLADDKETDELSMVLDEELKMMARICQHGGHVTGPYLKEMTQLAHTEYLIHGHTHQNPRNILKETLLAPTVTGSPLESACRVIKRHEPTGRGYYSGIIALIGHDTHHRHTLDSSILIRTADITTDGHLNIGVGATLVRHSTPTNEAAETRAKTAGLLTALNTHPPTHLRDHPDIQTALTRRNTHLAGFWLTDHPTRHTPHPDLTGLSALIIDAEDTFTAMITHQLQALGLHVTLTPHNQPHPHHHHDLTILGPGPGNPTDTTNPRITHLHTTITTLLTHQHPFLAVCLSHQILSHQLGFQLTPRHTPNQGTQRDIHLFGTPHRVGFYNTYTAHSHHDKTNHPQHGPIEISRDPHTTEIHALRGPHFTSLQFHPESILTHHGPHILTTQLKHTLNI